MEFENFLITRQIPFRMKKLNAALLNPRLPDSGDIAYGG
jgi:hypothetical protein